MLGFPAMVLSVPPLMVLVPTTFALGIQVAAPVIGLRAVITMVVDCFVEPSFGLFDGMLAGRPVVCQESGSFDEQQKGYYHERG